VILKKQWVESEDYMRISFLLYEVWTDNIWGKYIVQENRNHEWDNYNICSSWGNYEVNTYKALIVTILLF